MLLQNAKLAKKLDSKQISRLTCVVGDDDQLTESRVRFDFSSCKEKIKLEFVRLRRARRVGQTYITSIWTTLMGIFSSISLIRTCRPHLCLTNGPAISVVIALAIRCLELTTRDTNYKCEIIYIESFCRVKTLSLTGRIIYHLRLADRFFVQWPSLAKRYPRCSYEGIMV